MKTNSNQAGFAHVVLVLFVIVIAVVGFAGYSVYNRQQDKPVASSEQSASANDVPSAPEIKSTSDLDKASTTLDKVNPGDSGDGSQLDGELSNF